MDETGRATVRRISAKLLPLLGLIYMVAYIDRQNISYAKLQMVGDLGLSESAYGLGASLFFIGYFLFEVPSNLFLDRVGARRWFARIMLTWGVVTVLLGFTRNTTVFYILRFLLGAAEAGFFPGVLYTLTLWYPQRDRARAIGWFMLASAAANAVGSVIGGLLLDADGTLGLRGWQWVFLVTGAAAVVLVPAVLLLLPDRPEKARWLDEGQKGWLADVLAAERRQEGVVAHGNPLRALIDPRVLTLAVVYLGFPLSIYGISYWLPTIVKSFGVSSTANGLLGLIPWTLCGLALWGVPRLAARSRNEVWFITGPAWIGGLFLVLSVVLPGAPLKFAALSIAAAGCFSGQPVFWTLPPRFLTGAGAAAGFAAVNATGNLGGFVAQSVVPRIRDATGSELAPMLFLAAAITLAGLGALVIERRLPRAAAASS